MVNAREIFRKDPDFVQQIKNVCMYLKYDKFNPDGKVLTGDLIPKCTFYDLDGSFSTLSSIVQQKPLVLFTGKNINYARTCLIIHLYNLTSNLSET